jgi:hypothetical protein
MTLTPEIEVLDQLTGGDLALGVIATLFRDTARFGNALAALIEASEIRILDPTGAPVPEWRFAELRRQTDFLDAVSKYRASITEIGARRLG